LHQSWLQYGFMTMFRQLLAKNSVQQRLLAQVSGERQMTNLLHLAELVHDYCSRQNGNISAAIHWLNQQQSAQGEQDAAQLRLESDEQLVKIITIHKSKGLEYPIVFCPFLWDVSLRAASDEVLSYHDPQADNAPFVAMSEPYLSQAKDIVEHEQQAEDLRLLYVALTRARERCVVFWGNAKGVESSALFSLLHSQQQPDSSAMLAGLSDMAAQYSATTSVIEWVEQDSINYQARTQQQQLSARQFEGVVHAPWRIGSFSALTAGHDAELPDYDAASHNLMVEEANTGFQQDRFAFPKGAQAGTCLHAILEKWDFVDQIALAELVNKQLTVFGFDEKWQSVVVNWISEVVATPIVESGLSLNQLHPQQRMDEMAFYFPVAGLTVSGLQQALVPYFGDDVLAAVIKRLAFYDLTGFMKGFIDLVFEYDGKYYVVDYKSNYLGSNAEAYQSDKLDDAMLAHDYPLQYLIYTLALHRYLKLRLADYDPALHLGGVKYLFLRGMKPEWQQAGIFSASVDVELLNALDRYITLG